MKRLTLAIITALGLATAVTPANAISLFSVERNSDNLVLIDSETGQVNTIGTLGFDATDADLASFDNRLFILNSFYKTRADIYEVDPATGATLSSAQVTLGSEFVPHAEGLTNIGEKLIIGFSGNGNDARSESIGELSLTGAITNAISTAGDFDGLGGDGISQIFSADSSTGVGPTNLFNVDYTTGSLDLITNLSRTSNDIVFNGGNLFVLDSSPAVAEARLINTSITGEIQSNISLGIGEYMGLAIADSTPESVPEPFSIFAYLVFAALGVATLKR